MLELKQLRFIDMKKWQGAFNPHAIYIHRFEDREKGSKQIAKAPECGVVKGIGPRS